MKLQVVFLLFLFAALPAFCYDFLILSDTHYDSADVRIESKLSKGKSIEKDRNLLAWSKTMPILLPALGKASADETDFVLHLGDLTQGDFGSGEMHSKAMNDAKGRVSEFLKCPLYLVKGNHDIRGKGAENACRDFFASFLKDISADKQPNGTSYAFVHENDLFLCFDSIAPNLKFAKETLAKHPDVNHVFLCTHLPLLPCSYGNPGWLVFGKNPAERQEFLELLAARNAIVLCGHIHRTTLTVAEFPQGKIVQLTTFSQPKPKEVELKEYTVTDDLDNLKAKMKKQKDGAFQKDSVPYIKVFNVYTPRAGFIRLSAGKKAVTARLHYPDGSVAGKKIRLVSDGGVLSLLEDLF